MCAVPQRQQTHHKGISHMLVYRRTATSTKVGVFLQRCSLEFGLNLPQCNVFNALYLFILHSEKHLRCNEDLETGLWIF